MLKKLLILGGDGFCGWPTALHLSKHGYDVTILDNLSRRKIDIDLGINSLTPIKSIEERLKIWKNITGRTINFIQLDISIEYDKLLNIVKSLNPDTIIHFAEQRSAPYSMRNSNCKRYTVNNNLNATHNILCSIVESGIDAHLVHLGSMGVYGYETVNMPIPEGYLSVNISLPCGNNIEKEIMYPPKPGSVYHTTKTQDALFFYFYNKNDKIRITDLHQGIVWGTSTEETKLHEGLINRFDYDGDYGTVLNRFLVQSVIGHPITVYGNGGQTRAFIHIQDTVRCIKLAVENPPLPGERVKIFNQATETHSIRSLAALIAHRTGCEVRSFINPRNEEAENTLTVENRQFLELGFEPTTLSGGLLDEVREIVVRYRSRCDLSKIFCTSLWNSTKQCDVKGAPMLQKDLERDGIPFVY